MPGITFQPITTDSVMTNFVTFHGGHAGPEGCTVIDVFTPPRAGIVEAMAR